MRVVETRRKKDLDGLTHQLVARIAEEGFGLAVHEGDPPVGSGDDHGIRRALEQRLEARVGLLRVRQLTNPIALSSQIGMLLDAALGHQQSRCERGRSERRQKEIGSARGHGFGNLLLARRNDQNDRVVAPGDVANAPAELGRRHVGRLLDHDESRACSDRLDRAHAARHGELMSLCRKQLFQQRRGV